MELREGRILGLQRQVERLPQILGEESERVGPQDRTTGVGVLEHIVARGPELIAETVPRVAKLLVAGPVAIGHRFRLPAW